jgi:hypothetical protein
MWFQFLQICGEQNLETGRLATIGDLKTVGIAQNFTILILKNTVTHIGKGVRHNSFFVFARSRQQDKGFVFVPGLIVLATPITQGSIPHVVYNIVVDE